MTIHIRALEEADKASWRRLWAGYLHFYKTDLGADVSENTWARLVDPAGNIAGLIALDDAGEIIGFAHYLLHPGTWSAQPLCYLEDLFVSENARGSGAGRALIEALATKGRENGWKSVYWQTAADNFEAQSLYDKVAKRTDWVRYELDL